jgi:hypothetical protein
MCTFTVTAVAESEECAEAWMNLKKLLCFHVTAVAECVNLKKLLCFHVTAVAESMGVGESEKMVCVRCDSCCRVSPSFAQGACANL